MAGNEKAVGHFLILKGEIDDMLIRLQNLSENHFDVHPDDINWGHVGTIERYADLLKEITDSAFNEGEFANNS